MEESLLCNFQETISRARGIAMDAHVDWQKTVPESFRRNGNHFSKRIRRLLGIGQIILLIRFLATASKSGGIESVTTSSTNAKE